MPLRILRFSDGWRWGPLGKELKKPYMRELNDFLYDERTRPGFYPLQEDIFRAFKLTPLEEVKVVILGQDPYPRPGEAMGLSFSVPVGAALPKSLRNIYREVENNVGAPVAKCGDLTHWAQQGVLLLNSILTVRRGKDEEGSHAGRGWECFTNQAVTLISRQRKEKAVFCLWGRTAQEKIGLLVHTPSEHILTASHPSPPWAYKALPARKALPACPRFVGCGHFSEVNRLLKAQRHTEIRW